MIMSLVDLKTPVYIGTMEIVITTLSAEVDSSVLETINAKVVMTRVTRAVMIKVILQNA
jgi:hypothetical protein